MRGEKWRWPFCLGVNPIVDTSVSTIMNCSNYTSFNLFINYFEILGAPSSYTSQLMANSSDPVIDDIIMS